MLTGLRFGEATALEWSDVLDDRILVSKSQTWRKLGPTKTRARRSVALPPELAEILREHHLDLVTRRGPGLAAGMVFPSAAGNYLHTPGVRKALLKALATARVTLRATIHGMRRTLNSELRKRVPGDVVRSITGHTGEDMTEHYSDVALEEKHAALAMLGVARLVGKT